MSNNQTVALDRRELREFLAEELEVPEGDFTDETQFSDLGVDSLVAMEIVVQLEKRYKVKMDEEELPQITSVNSVYELLSTKLGAA